VFIVARKRRVTPAQALTVRGVSADHHRIRVPLHPQCAQFLEMVEQAGEPPLYELSPEAARAGAEAQAELIGPGPEVAAVDDIAVPVRDDEIPARRYEPESSSATLVWFPGGGWVFDGLDNHDAMCRRLAHVAGSTVICVGHRLAPEHRFPAPLDDCWDALNWAAQQHPSVPLMVGGDSSGGNLAAVCALRARDRGRPALALQVLVYPVTDHDMTTASYVEHGAGALVGRQEMEWFWNHYVVDVAQRETSDVSPLRAPDVSKLPPAIVAVAEYDPLRDDGLAYAERLRAAGTDVTLRRYDVVFHGYFSMVNVFERANEAIDAVGGDIRSAISAQAVR
jgi:acetyl esterase